MKNSFFFRLSILIVTDTLALMSAFWIAYYLRSMRDWIPFIELRGVYISPENFVPFVVWGVIIMMIAFYRGRLYSLTSQTPITEEIRRICTYSFFWFLSYIGFVYLGTGFLFSDEIPRLIILYTGICMPIFIIITRSILRYIFLKYTPEIQNILIIYPKGSESKIDNYPLPVGYTSIIINDLDTETIENTIRSNTIDSILYLSNHQNIGSIYHIAKIYGIPVMYPKISISTPIASIQEEWIGNTPIIRLSPLSMTRLQSFLKRIFDIILSIFLLIILIPVFILISLGIHISDPTGPVIYKNRRIGQNGNIFALYKFRYMYWKYCTKEEYNINDDAISYEEELKKSLNTREGPLYKIKNDPRKMWWGKWIERLSLDELPQLYNVLIGDMSLIGPRPHQPREIALYDEADRQVLTIKPGITGMAQVYGRDKNTFHEEIMLDIYYIEHYSPSLDIAILLRTILVVIRRFW